MSTGIYIKGMEKPENCHKCKFVDILSTCPCNKMEYEDFLYNGSLAVGVHKDCPIISVPPHGRLIDATERIKVQIYDDMTEDYRMVEMTIDDLLSQSWVDASAPTIIEAEEERS